MDSQLLGRLHLAPSGCVGVTEGGEFTLAVFPHGTTWTAAGGLDVGGQQLPLGGDVRLHGGLVSSEFLQLEETARCSQPSEVFLAH